MDELEELEESIILEETSTKPDNFKLELIMRTLVKNSSRVLQCNDKYRAVHIFIGPYYQK